MAYVDGFVVPLPKKNLAAYRAMAKKAAKVWREHGALEVRECVADDVKMGKWTSFPRSVKMKKNETVVFSYIVYKSRADRDKCLAKVMKDPRLAKMMNPKAMPFDGKRMIYGGVKGIVEGEAGRSADGNIIRLSFFGDTAGDLRTFAPARGAVARLRNAMDIAGVGVA